MAEQILKTEESAEAFVKDYSKYSFSDKEDYIFKSKRGLTKEIVEEISKMKNEPQWMLDFRLQSLEIFWKKAMPSWGADLSTIDFDNIYYYIKPSEKTEKNWDDVPEYIKKTFDRLGIPEAERKFLAGVGAQYECLTGDTKVFTNPSGPKDIRSIKKGDKVFAYDEASGEIKPSLVKDVACKGERPVFEINIGTRKIKTTINHPFLALMHDKKEKKRRGRYKKEWRYLSDLKVGDLVAIVKQLPYEGKPYQLPEPEKASYRHNKVKIPEYTNEDLMWFLGLYLGDGFLHKEKKKARIEIAIPMQDKQLREELAGIIQNIFSIEASVVDNDRVTIYSSILSNFIEKIGFGGKAKTKKIPEWLFSLPKNQILAFLGGYLDSDGYVRDHPKNHDIVFTSVNKQILEDTRMLAMLCGIAASNINEFQSKHVYDKGRMLTAFRLQLSGNADIIPCKSEKRFLRLGRKKYYHSYKSAKNTSFKKHANDFIGFAKIESIKPMGTEPVYDIEVENYHNFVAEGVIVHNSEVVYHKIREDLEKLGVLFLDMDSGLREYPELVKKYFATVIPNNDNKFAALNSAVWSGGSFIYVPKGVKVDLPLQAYFRINAQNMGQFERTLIICDEGSSVHYIEGCFTKGAPVKTLEGTKKIEDVAVGDIVLTHTGSYKKVYELQRRKHSGILCTINYYGDTRQEIKITGGHPVLAVKRKKAEYIMAEVNNQSIIPPLCQEDTKYFQSNICVRDYKNSEFKPEWIEAAQLSKNDYAAIPIDRTVISKDSRFFSIKIGRGRHQSKTLEFKVDTDKDFFRLVGYYMAEGSVINENYLSFTFNKNERDYLEDASDLLEKLFGKAPLEYKEYKGGVTLVLCSTLAARLFKQEFGKGAKNKKLPKWLMLESCEKQAEFIKGYWRGDGSFINKEYSWGAKRMFRINTISESLAEQTRDLLLRLDVFASINVWKRKLPRSDSFVIYVGGSHLEKFSKIVEYSGSDVDSGNSALLLKQKLVSYAEITEKYAFVPVKSIKKEIVKELDVYNFSVEDDESYISHGIVVHNCTAPVYASDSLHTAVVELIAMPGSKLRYTTIQNWSNNVYNLVTKRAFAYENSTVEWVDGNLGSKITMKYPGIILLGEGARGEVLSVAFAGKGQHQDAGAKIIHMAPNTSSKITSKSVSKDGGRTTYRGLLKVAKGASNVKSSVVCDALILDERSASDTVPYMEINEKKVSIGHEASVGKVSEEQLFYLMSRGLSEEQAMTMIVSGFIEPFTKELPMEYAVELNKLIALEMEGSVG